ncbi:MAG: hypothetical protein Q8M40_12200 [Legionella sp.]|nr:hypothetical protein [Legionella sp.]
MNLLNRALALSLSITLLPLNLLISSIITQLKYIIFISLVLIFALLNPLTQARSVSDFFKNIIKSTLLLLYIAITMSFITMVTTVGFSLFCIYNLTKDVINIVATGLRRSNLEGLKGWWQLMIQTNPIDHLLYHTSNQSVEWVRGILDSEILLSAIFNKLYPLKVSNYKIKVFNQTVDPLTSQEVIESENILNSYSSLKKTDPDLKKLHDRLYQYKELSATLHQVNQSLISGDLTQLEDQIMSMEIQTPILLIKQYEKNNHWYTVPASSKVTGKEQLLAWIKTKPVHPLFNESFSSPEFQDAPDTQPLMARYGWYELTKNNCYSQELDQGAIEIRHLLKLIPEKLSHTSKIIQEETHDIASKPGRWFNTKENKRDDIELDVTIKHTTMRL